MTDKKWRAVIMAGGRATRFHPVSAACNKHLLPVYDKPLIYFPLTTLMLAGMRDFIILTTPEAVAPIQALLGDGSQWGLDIIYRAQHKPAGIADAFKVCAKDLAGHYTAMILGDNIFYGHGLPEDVMVGKQTARGATIYAYEVGDPRAFGVVEFDASGRAISLEEKPKHPKSNFAVPGLYFYDDRAVDLAASLTPSARGELEITDLNRWYLDEGSLQVQQIGRGIAWLDGGTPEGLFEASNYIRALERRQGLRAACPEEVALRKGFISITEFENTLAKLPACDYRDYLNSIGSRWPTVKA